MTFYPLRGALYIEVKGGKNILQTTFFYIIVFDIIIIIVVIMAGLLCQRQNTCMCVLLSSPCMCWAVGGWEWCTETTVLSDEKEGRAAQSRSGFAGERLLVCGAHGRCMAVAFVTVILWLVCACVCVCMRERERKTYRERMTNWSGWKKEKLLPQGSRTFI